MNDDAFEKKLESLAGSLSRPDPTPRWKADILARARREAVVPMDRAASRSGGIPAPVRLAADAIKAPSRRALPPRWLMAAWSTAWALIALMHFTTPVDRTAASTSMHISASASDSASGRSVHGDAPTTLTLLAFHRELSAASISTFDTP